MTDSKEIFWVIDDGRPFDTLVRDARRFPSMAAACAERKPDQGLWEVSRRPAALAVEEVEA